MEERSASSNYIATRERWLGILGGPIRYQLQDMLTNDAIFRAYHQMRIYALENLEKTIFHNSLFTRMIDYGYVTYQLSAIRRLTDTRSSTISLRRLINELRKKRSTLRRDNYVCYDSTPYDWKGVRDKEWEQSPPEPGELRQVPSSGPVAWGASARRHGYFDILAGVEKSNRKRTDTINDRVFERLLQHLETTSGNVQKTNDYIAHFSSKNPTTESNRGFPPVTFTELDVAQRSLAEAYCFISGPILLGPSHNLVLYPRFPALLGFDEQPADDASIKIGRETFSSRRKMIETWRDVDWSQFVN